MRALAAGAAAEPWLPVFRAAHRRLVPLLAAPALLAAPLLHGLPWPTLAAGAAAVVLLGVPHGALDHRVAAPWLRKALGRAWFPAFNLGYLGLAACVLAAWALAPLATLLGFLALSVLHFGLEDAAAGRRDAAEVLARGGLPVAVPVLADPEGTGRLLDALAGTGGVPDAVRLAALLWLAPAAAYALRAARGRDPDLLEVAALAVVLAALPALAGFAFYFVAVHAPRHTAELAARHAPGDAAAGWSWALFQSLPLTLGTLALGAALFAALPPGPPDERLLRTLFWGLAALTVPHMLLVWLDERLGRGGRLD